MKNRLLGLQAAILFIFGILLNTPAIAVGTLSGLSPAPLFSVQNIHGVITIPAGNTVYKLAEGGSISAGARLTFILQDGANFHTAPAAVTQGCGDQPLVQVVSTASSVTYEVINLVDVNGAAKGRCTISLGAFSVTNIGFLSKPPSKGASFRRQLKIELIGTSLGATCQDP